MQNRLGARKIDGRKMQMRKKCLTMNASLNFNRIKEWHAWYYKKGVISVIYNNNC